jgi:transglutaminase/protease-like cytokinesis protein 3
MSIASSSAGASHTGSLYSESSGLSDKQQKPAKLAIQSPTGKIIRFTRKQEYGSSAAGSGRTGSTVDEDEGLGSTWETVIKVGERGVYRGLVLADRSARWCVFAEWECV